ncbi:hypothetical protein [Blastococcus sp. SYSU DS0617]
MIADRPRDAGSRPRRVTPRTSVDAVSDRAPQGARRGPRQDTTVSVRAGADLHERIVAALHGLPADVHEADDAAGRYRARTRWSWKSWGEEVSVQLFGDGAALEAVVSSRPVVGTTVVDYGKGPVERGRRRRGPPAVTRPAVSR